MFCPSCGKPCDSTSTTCASCGASLPPPVPSGWTNVAVPPPLPPPPPDTGPQYSRGAATAADPGLGQFMPALMAAIAMLKFDRSAIRRVASSPEATRMAVIFIAIVGLGWGLGNLHLFGIILGPIMMLLGALIGVTIVHIAATIAGGRGEWESLFRCHGFLETAAIVGIIPLLGSFLAFLAYIWVLVATVPTLEEVYHMSRERAILTIVIIIAAYVIFFGILAIFFVGMIAALFSGH